LAHSDPQVKTSAVCSVQKSYKCLL